MDRGHETRLKTSDAERERVTATKLEADLCEISKGAISKFHRSLAPLFYHRRLPSILRLGDDSTRLLEIFTADAEGRGRHQAAEGLEDR